MDFVDVVSRLEIPPAPLGYRYLDFLGGEKELRCFLVPQDMPRNIFMECNSDLLDASLSPVYSHNGICVRQDASYALPGFYIVSLTEFYPAIDMMDEVTYLRLSFIIRSVRSGMRQMLGINYVHLYYEEKINPSCKAGYRLKASSRDRTLTIIASSYWS